MIPNIAIWISGIITLFIILFLFVFWIIQMVHALKKNKVAWFVWMLVSGLGVYPIGVVLAVIYYVKRRDR